MWSNPKREIWRSERYLSLVRQLQVCVNCGHLGNCQAAHIGTLTDGKGGALKTPDSMVASLCSLQPNPVNESWKEGCHEAWDQRKGQFKGLTWDEYQYLGFMFVAKTQIMLLEGGLLKVSAS